MKTIQHCELPKLQDYHIQATSLIIEDWTGNLTISAAFTAPRSNLTHQQFIDDYLSRLGPRFISRR